MVEPALQVTDIAKRIAERMHALGKNPSSLALEAGLGRSSVRDILTGKAQNPRLDTLQKLTGPLNCSLEYLTGASSLVGRPAIPNHTTAHIDGFEVQAASQLEVGVFRLLAQQVPVEMMEKEIIYTDVRHQDWQPKPYLMRDQSLIDRRIVPGDLLTAVSPIDDDIIPLHLNDLVILRRTVGDNPAAELSARIVEHVGEVVHFASDRAYGAPRIEATIPSADGAELIKNVYFTKNGVVEVLGRVIRLTRPSIIV